MRVGGLFMVPVSAGIAAFNLGFLLEPIGFPCTMSSRDSACSNGSRPKVTVPPELLTVSVISWPPVL